MMKKSDYRTTWRYNIRRYWPLYLMVLPGVIFLIVFKYIPMLGCVIAFQDYSVFKGILGSDWVGLKHFMALLSYFFLKGKIVNILSLVSKKAKSKAIKKCKNYS